MAAALPCEVELALAPQVADGLLIAIAGQGEKCAESFCQLRAPRTCYLAPLLAYS
jgi:hypothetical protein